MNGQIAILLQRGLPPGAIPSWKEFEDTAKTTRDPIYIICLNVDGGCPLIQFRTPAALVLTPTELSYKLTRERIAQAIFFNRDFLPTFFAFDNYMHVMAFETRLKEIGVKLVTRQLN